MRKVTSDRGVTTVDTKDVFLTDMRTIEFLKNAKDECLILITLRDGRKILTSDNYVVSKDKRPEGVTPSPEFEGCYHGDPKNTVQYEIKGRTSGGGI